MLAVGHVHLLLYNYTRVQEDAYCHNIYNKSKACYAIVKRYLTLVCKSREL